MTLGEELKARGLVEHTSADIQKILRTPRTVYYGVDPSSDSMQAGNLVGLLVVRRLSEAGHRIILLVGGGTGLIGDPRESGERTLADARVIAANKKKLRAQMQQIVGAKIQMVDNADWLLKEKLIDFLRDIGKHFTVNELVKRDIIRKRLETPDESISYTEFAYSLLQGFDYLMLHRTRRCDLQVGGSDQWTNILSGVELIRRKEGKEAFALTWPLVTDAAGKKFGKSEGNAMWLDPKKTSPFAFYQFWINQPDEEVEKLLKMFTLLPLPEIASLLEKHRKTPGEREAQETLARLVTEIVHGPGAAAHASAATDALFGGRLLSELSAIERNLLIQGAPNLTVKLGTNIVDVLVESNLASSKGDAKRLIEGKGIQLAGKIIESPDTTLTKEHFDAGLALLKKGKRETLVLVLK